MSAHSLCAVFSLVVMAISADAVAASCESIPRSTRDLVGAAWDGDDGLFQVNSASIPASREIVLSASRQNVERAPLKTDFSSLTAAARVTVNHRFQVSAAIDLQNRSDIDKSGAIAFSGVIPLDGPNLSTPAWRTGRGDVRATAKVLLVDACGGGVSLKGGIAGPTDVEERGVVTGELSYFSELLLSRAFSAQLVLYAEGGFTINNDSPLGEVGDYVRGGTGLVWRRFSRAYVEAEIAAARQINGDPKIHTVDAAFGLRLGAGEWFTVRPALLFVLKGADSDASWATRTGFEVTVASRIWRMAGRDD